MGARATLSTLLVLGCYGPTFDPPDDGDGGSGDGGSGDGAPEVRRCGNGTPEPPEDCDDADGDDGDGCTRLCLACEVTYEGRCYERSTSASTYEGLADFCSTRGGHTVTYATAAEEQTVYQAFRLPDRDLWIGIDDRDLDGAYRWITLEAPAYQHWNETPTTGACGAHDRGWMSGEWTSLPCNDLLAGICEREGWSVSQDGHAYLLLHETKAWDAAKARCEGLGGHLATISSDAEETFVIGLFPGAGEVPAWIGLHDEDVEGIWDWVTGETEPLDTYWASGEPSGGLLENCVHVDPAGWRDDACDLGYRYVCEID